MALFNLKDSSAINTLPFFLCSVFFFLPQRPYLGYYYFFFLEFQNFNGFFQRLKALLVLSSHLFSVGAGIRCWWRWVGTSLTGLWCLCIPQVITVGVLVTYCSSSSSCIDSISIYVSIHIYMWSIYIYITRSYRTCICILPYFKQNGWRCHSLMSPKLHISNFLYLKYSILLMPRKERKKEKEREERLLLLSWVVELICPLVSWSIATWIKRKMSNQSKYFCYIGMLYNGNENDSMFLSV